MNVQIFLTGVYRKNHVCIYNSHTSQLTLFNYKNINIYHNQLHFVLFHRTHFYSISFHFILRYLFIFQNETRALNIYIYPSPHTAPSYTPALSLSLSNDSRKHETRNIQQKLYHRLTISE